MAMATNTLTDAQQQALMRTGRNRFYFLNLAIPTTDEPAPAAEWAWVKARGNVDDGTSGNAIEARPHFATVKGEVVSMQDAAASTLTLNIFVPSADPRRDPVFMALWLAWRSNRTVEVAQVFSPGLSWDAITAAAAILLPCSVGAIPLGADDQNYDTSAIALSVSGVKTEGTFTSTGTGAGFTAQPWAFTPGT